MKQYAPTLQGLLGGINQINPLIANEKLGFSSAQSTGESRAQQFDPNAGRGNQGGGIYGNVTTNQSPSYWGRIGLG
jgi:hypothetical protein